MGITFLLFQKNNNETVMKNHVFLSAIYFLVICCLLNILELSIIYAQPTSLGWNGEYIIPLNEFTDSKNWVCNYQPATGDACYVNTDSASLNLHWIFSGGNRYKYAQCYQVLNPAVSLADVDIIALDVKGTDCDNHRDIKIKFEDGTYQASYKWENLARITRWCERISVLKSQFSDADQVNWDKITVISLEVCSDASDLDISQDSGIVSFRKLQSDSISNWQRATSFELLKDTGSYQMIKQNAIDAIIARQSPIGLFYTWREDSSSYLYGHGFILKLLSTEGIWENDQPVNQYAIAAEKLALFFTEHQDALGFWPRAWHSNSGAIKQYLEQDSTIWFGDFPWVIIGLQNYHAKSGDVRVENSIDKAKSFLYELIDSNGKLNTINPVTNKIKEVTSCEAYAATILSLFELGDDRTANKMIQYINDNAWDDNLKYWKEGTTSSRIVLFANTWLSQITTNSSHAQKAYDALSLVGKVLFTKGPGEPCGLDGIGPVATWYEGTLSYICAGGPGSQYLFDKLISHINDDGTVPHYNDSLGSMAGIWAENWSSLDGTAWLYYAASKKSPFIISNIESNFTTKKPNVFKLYQNYPNPFNPVTKITYSIQKSDIVNLNVYDILGREIQIIVNKLQKANTYSVNFDASNLSSGIYFYRLQVGNDFKETKKMLLLR